jgi:hypothetical protein
LHLVLHTFLVCQFLAKEMPGYAASGCPSHTSQNASFTLANLGPQKPPSDRAK